MPPNVSLQCNGLHCRLPVATVQLVLKLKVKGGASDNPEESKEEGTHEESGKREQEPEDSG
jgi:hypothetical protein